MLQIRWMWALLDCPEANADAAWAYWCSVTGSTLSAQIVVVHSRVQRLADVHRRAQA